MAVDLLKLPSSILLKSTRRLTLVADISNEIDKIENKRIYEYKVYMLTGFYIVNLISIWQVFIENLVNYGCKLIERNSNSRAEKLLYRISCENAKTAIKKFNTPNKQSINLIFYHCFSIEEITKCWKENDGSFMKEYNSLTLTLQERHRFSHTGRHNGNISLDKTQEISRHLFYLSVLIEKKFKEELDDYGIK